MSQFVTLGALMHKFASVELLRTRPVLEELADLTAFERTRFPMLGNWYWSNPMVVRRVADLGWRKHFNLRAGLGTLLLGRRRRCCCRLRARCCVDGLIGIENVLFRIVVLKGAVRVFDRGTFIRLTRIPVKLKQQCIPPLERMPVIQLDGPTQKCECILELVRKFGG